MDRRKVDLPQPEGPIQRGDAAGATSMVTSNSTWCAPYQKLYAAVLSAPIIRTGR